VGTRDEDRAMTVEPTTLADRRKAGVSQTSTRPALVSLALQGGGSFGAFTWGVLDRLLEAEGIAFDAISGISAGAVNAVVLQNYKKYEFCASRTFDICDRRSSARPAERCHSGSCANRLRLRSIGGYGRQNVDPGTLDVV